MATPRNVDEVIRASQPIKRKILSTRLDDMAPNDELRSVMAATRRVLKNMAPPNTVIDLNLKQNDQEVWRRIETASFKAFENARFRRDEETE